MNLSLGGRGAPIKPLRDDSALVAWPPLPRLLSSWLPPAPYTSAVGTCPRALAVSCAVVDPYFAFTAWTKIR